jgi:predicted chitinase
MAKITSEILRATAPLTKKATRDRFLPYLNLLLPHFEINNELRICAFLATCTLESDYWKATAEYGKGKGRKYAKVYTDTGKAYYGRGIIQNTWRDAYEDFTAYVKRNWSWLRELEDANRIQSPDFVLDPDLLTQPFWAVLAACWFWHKNKLNKLADGGLKNFFAIQGITNRGNATKKALAYAERLQIYENLRRFLPDGFSLDPLKDSAAVTKPTDGNPKENEQAGGGESTSTESSSDTQETATQGQPPITEPEKIAIEKPEKQNFLSKMWKKISGFFVGQSLLDYATEKWGQVQALGLSPEFWKRIFYIAIACGVVYIIAEFYRHWQWKRDQNKITDLLVTANSTSDNVVTLAATEDLPKLKEAGYRIIQRGA